MKAIRNFVFYLLSTVGWELRKKVPIALPVEATVRDKEIYAAVEGFTMTSPERIWALMNAVKYILDTGVKGDFVECGVWRGGSAMVMAILLRDADKCGKHLWLYDTFEGMTEPTPDDIEISSGESASSLLKLETDKGGRNIWCMSPLEEVTKNLAGTGYPMDHVRMVKGDVTKTLVESAPNQIALLRLDTDWYESTKMELVVLYPRLVSGGICILDDYGYWGGAKKAVDEYFSENGIVTLMHRIDATGRMFIKP